MMKNSLLLISIASFIFSCESPKGPSFEVYDSLAYDVYFGDRLAGFQNAWKDSNGAINYTFEFNDRGRGPHFDEILELDNDGQIISQKITGNNYLKEKVQETFQNENNKSSWTNNAESGEKEGAGQAMYLSLNGAPGKAEILIQRLVNEQSKQINLLPSGKAILESYESYTFGDSIKLYLAEVSGLGFTPTYTWIDENNRFYGTVSSWFSCLPKGSVNIKAELLKIQESREKQYLENIAIKLTEKPGQTIAIKNVSIFDSNTGSVEENQTVIIDGNVISKVQSGDEETPADAVVIDGTGKTLMPSLFDNHTHISKTDGILHIAAGVTSVRDMANSLDLPDLKKEFESNNFIGPRIVVMSGFVDQEGPYAGPTGKIVRTVEEGIEGIQFYKDRGYQQIKLYSSIDPKWVSALTKKAHDLDLRISGHIPSFMTAADAVKDGYDEIQHVNMLALNFLPDTIDTRTPLRFSMVAEHTHALDLKSKEFTDFVDLLKSKNTVVDPTVSIFEGMFTTKPQDPNPSFAGVMDRLPVQVRRNFYGGGLPVPEGKEQQFKDSFQKLLDIVYEIHSNGVTIVPGTDDLAGFGLHTELENYVRAGISASEVLQLATIVSAKVASVDDQLGSIEEGKMADVILIDGSPTENISDIRKVVLTIKDGNIYRPDQLYAAIGVQ